MVTSWNKALKSDYKKCFDILNSNSISERDTYVKLSIELFEIAKKQLGITNAKLKFVETMGNSLGVSTVLDHSVTLNLEKMEKQNFHKIVSTIYHELTHLRQEKTEAKKEIDKTVPAEFPVVHAYGNENFLPKEILGISPFLFYYTCKHEKEARDNGSACATDFFRELKNLSASQPTKSDTSSFIEECFAQVRNRWSEENFNNMRATIEVGAFIKKNPNFTHDAFEKIKQEFNRDQSYLPLMSKERNQLEDRFVRRIGSLVLLGCDDNLKNDVLSFASNNFCNVGNIFNTMISVIDSPYSKVSKDDFNLLFQYAEKVNCPKDLLFNYLTSWDKNYINKVTGSSSQKIHITLNGIDYEL